MNERAVLRQGSVVSSEARAEPVDVEPGPWLFFAAPVSFVLTLVTVCWLSLTSF